MDLLGKKGQSSSILSVILAGVFIVLGLVIFGRVVEQVPTDLTENGDVNATVWGAVGDTVSSYGLLPIVLLAMIIALVAGAFIMRRG